MYFQNSRLVFILRLSQFLLLSTLLNFPPKQHKYRILTPISSVPFPKPCPKSDNPLAKKSATDAKTTVRNPINIKMNGKRFIFKWE
jgi:hypothetical protein